MEDESDRKVKSFKELGLCDELVEAVKRMNWDAPTRIQAQAIPHALKGKDIIGVANTGTGKTAAFGLPILQALHDSGADVDPAFLACVLVPVRELAIQIVQQLRSLGAGIGLKTAVLVGGRNKKRQRKDIAKRPHIIVATPGSLLDQLTNNNRFSLKALKYLVLDEADKLLGDGFETSIDDILSFVPVTRRTYLFSATFNSEIERIQSVCLRNPVKINTGSNSTVDTLKEYYLFIPKVYKDCYLVHILTSVSGSTLVFTNSQRTTRFLVMMLRNLGFRAGSMSGGMFQAKRFRVLKKFKAGICNILVCTNLLGRGMDILGVDMIINYCIPEQWEEYIHRVGRTARAGRSGAAISLVSQYEIRDYLLIEKYIGKKLPRFPANEEEVLLQLKRVTEASSAPRKKVNEKQKKKKRERTEDEDTGDEDDQNYSKRCKSSNEERN